jgi:hypothetical protein
MPPETVPARPQGHGRTGPRSGSLRRHGGPYPRAPDDTRDDLICPACGLHPACASI